MSFIILNITVLYIYVHTYEYIPLSLIAQVECSFQIIYENIHFVFIFQDLNTRMWVIQI